LQQRQGRARRAGCGPGVGQLEGATTVVLTAEDVREIDAAAAKIPVQGDRYTKGSSA
jgi:hypothetical protein